VGDGPRIEEFLVSATQHGTEFTTGTCWGFDAIAAEWLVARYPNAVHRLVVPANRSQVDFSIVGKFTALAREAPEQYLIEWMPDDTDYRDRNARILEHSDELVAVAQSPETAGSSRRSGTWMTVRMAREGALPVRQLVLWEG